MPIERNRFHQPASHLWKTYPQANDNPQPQGAELSSHDDNFPALPLAATGTDATPTAQ